MLQAPVERVLSGPDLGAVHESLLRQIGASRPGTAVPPEQAAELVAHLCQRQARIRQSAPEAAEEMFAGLDDALLDREKVRDLFGPETEAAIATIRREMKAFWQSAVGPGRGFATREELEAFVLSQFKTDFGRLLDTQSPLLRQFFTTIRARIEEAARDAHARVLDENLATGQRLQRLQALHWHVEVSRGLILPDCLAIASKGDGTFQPLVYVRNDEVALVLVPVARGRLLVGRRPDAPVPSLSGVNDALAACAWKYFAASEQTAKLEKLVPVIGQRTRIFLRSLVTETIQRIA